MKKKNNKNSSLSKGSDTVDLSDLLQNSLLLNNELESQFKNIKSPKHV